MEETDQQTPETFEDAVDMVASGDDISRSAERLPLDAGSPLLGHLVDRFSLDRPADVLGLIIEAAEAKANSVEYDPTEYVVACWDTEKADRR